MSEETRKILVNSVSSSEYITITNDFRKLEKEIEKLKQELEFLKKLNDANYKSFIDANNIINELEKWCNGSIYDDDQLYEKVLHKLQELKGSENNE